MDLLSLGDPTRDHAIANLVYSPAGGQTPPSVWTADHGGGLGGSKHASIPHPAAATTHHERGKPPRPRPARPRRRPGAKAPTRSNNPPRPNPTHHHPAHRPGEGGNGPAPQADGNGEQRWGTFGVGREGGDGRTAWCARSLCGYVCEPFLPKRVEVRRLPWAHFLASSLIPP